MIAPILFAWAGDAMVPVSRFKKEADARFVVGERYRMDVIEERSVKAHAAYFATVSDAWRNLPEDQSDRFPSPDHLRRFALIKTGFANSREIVCATNNEAVRLAALVKSLDSYSLAAVSDRAVQIWTAESQSYRAMGKERFMASQAAVREFCASLIGVAPDDLEREAGRAA